MENAVKWLDSPLLETWTIVELLVIAFILLSIVKICYLNLEIKLVKTDIQTGNTRNMIQTMVLVQETERKRIAADLHDSLIGKLVALKIKNQSKCTQVEFDNLLDDSITEARLLSHNLYPPMLEFMDLAAVIDDLVDVWKAYFTILIYKNIKHPGAVGVGMKLHVTRIIQELLMNVYKHAKATEVNFTIKITASSFFMIVADNGQGFNLGSHNKGLGLRNIDWRVKHLGGDYKFKSTGKGTASIFRFKIETV